MSYSLPLDLNVIQTLRELPAGGERLVGRLVHVYLEDAPDNIDALHAALEKDDAGAVAFAAHSLKSSSANLGARRIAALAAEVEQSARSGSLAGCEQRLRDIRAAYADVRQELLQLAE